ncbi:Methyltransferase domain-containing protein [Haloechinothrix alba]|uniref:Methyltransferase domain-containing protein n=1 Tax=Haloechinothrix alba TaxID=664784 RepID=A0A238Z297_9PSEU|nr:class I SAM-dependent methyltransferase [Haloechinothrix alba]SNR76963.1 Methyltransferase domain-containing protein [Haloechinothrix alba]
MTAADFDARRYWDKRLKRRWSLHGVGMVKLSHRYNRWMYRVRRFVFRRTVRTLPVDVRSSAVVDIGSGTGFYIALWQRLGARSVNGVDIADSAVERLRTKFPDVRFERVDVSDELPFREGEFDIVSAFDVLFHIVDDERYEQALVNIHKLLGPDGWFVFSEHFVSRKKLGAKHYVSRSREEIGDLVQRAGFDVVSRRPGFVLMAPPYGSNHRWRWLLWNRVQLPVMKRERLGGVLGAVMFPIELLLTRVRRRTPSMEIVVCRKRSDQ